MEKAAYSTYLVTLILSVLLFGAMHAYAYTLMTLGVLVATVMIFTKQIRKNEKTGFYSFRFPETGVNLLFFVLLAYLFFQLAPLPENVIRLLSPEAGIVQEKSIPASSLVHAPQTEKKWLSPAPYTHPVRMSILRLAVYGLFFLGFIQTLNSKKRIDLGISLILITGSFEALYGLMQTYSGSEHIWWFKKQAYRGDICGTYINRNHFAGLMEMGVVVAAAFAAALAPRNRKGGKVSEGKQNLRAWISNAFPREEEITKRILILFSGVVLGIGLIFSASRGGMIAVAGAMLLMGLLLVVRKGYRQKGYILLLLFLLVSSYAVKIGIEYPLGRFKSFYLSLEARARYVQKTIDMFDDYKVAGVGVGNFKYVYPKYQAAEDKKVFIRFAHNDWAQYLAEAGIAGACLLVIGISYYVFRTINAWKQRKDPYAVCLGVLPLVVLTAIGIHSYSDFNLHVPANFMTLVAIMAIGYAALHLERHHRRERMGYRYYEWPIRYRGGMALVVIFGLIGWTGWWSIRHFMAEAYCNTVPNSTLNRDQNPPVGEVAKAIEWDTLNAEYWYKLAQGIEAQSSKLKGENEDDGTRGWLDEWMKERRSQIGRQRPDGSEMGSELRLPASDFRVLALERAVELNPFEAQYHLQLGWAYSHLWQEKDYHTKWLPAADISMDRGAYFAGVKNPHLHQELGNYWTMRSKSVYPNNPVYHEAWAKAVWHYQKAIEIEVGGPKSEVGQEEKKRRPESKAVKDMKKEIHDYVWNFYPDEEFVEQVIASPSSPSVD